jgi:aldose 1-epimerase
MSFSIQRFTEQGLEQVLLQDNDSKTQAVILPKYGGILNGLIVMINGERINLIESYPDEAAAGNVAKSFLSSKLSPFVCRMANAQYTLNGKLFEIEHKFVDGNAIHGLLYDKAFTIVTEFSDDEKASVTLKYNYKKDDKGYPFSYRCEITYTLLPNDLLKLETVITNLDDDTIPLSDGLAPLFRTRREK